MLLIMLRCPLCQKDHGDEEGIRGCFASHSKEIASGEVILPIGTVLGKKGIYLITDVKVSGKNLRYQVIREPEHVEGFIRLDRLKYLTPNQVAQQTYPSMATMLIREGNLQGPVRLRVGDTLEYYSRGELNRTVNIVAQTEHRTPLGYVIWEVIDKTYYRGEEEKASYLYDGVLEALNVPIYSGLTLVRKSIV